MLNKATVIDNDDFLISTYNIEIVESDGTEHVVSTILGIVQKGEGFDLEENARRQHNRIPVTVFK